MNDRYDNFEAPGAVSTSRIRPWFESSVSSDDGKLGASRQERLPDDRHDAENPSGIGNGFTVAIGEKASPPSVLLVLGMRAAKDCTVQ
jgi:hypothetical protein